MLRTTAKALITPKGRNYGWIPPGDRKGRLSVDAVAEEINRPVEYTRALLMPYPLSLGGRSAKSYHYPAMVGRTSRPGGDTSGFVKAFPLFGKKREFSKYMKVHPSTFKTE